MIKKIDSDQPTVKLILKGGLNWGNRIPVNGYEKKTTFGQFRGGGMIPTNHKKSF